MSNSKKMVHDGPVFNYITTDNDNRQFEVTQPVDGLTAGYVQDLERQVNDLIVRNNRLQNVVVRLAEQQINDFLMCLKM